MLGSSMYALPKTAENVGRVNIFLTLRLVLLYNSKRNISCLQGVHIHADS